MPRQASRAPRLLGILASGLCLAVVGGCGESAQTGSASNDSADSADSTDSTSGGTGDDEPLWAFELGDAFVNVAAYPDGDLLVQSVADSECCEGTIAYFALARVDPSGSPRWARPSISIDDAAPMPNGMCPSDEGMRFAATTFAGGDGPLLSQLGLIDAEGNISVAPLTLPPTSGLLGLEMVCTSDGGYFMSSANPSIEQPAYLAHYDATGTQRWLREFVSDDPDDLTRTSITQPTELAEGGFALIEVSLTPGEMYGNYQLSIFDAQAELVFAQALGSGVAKLVASDQRILAILARPEGLEVLSYSFTGELLAQQSYEEDVGSFDAAYAISPQGELLGRMNGSGGLSGAQVLNYGDANDLATEPSELFSTDFKLAGPILARPSGPVIVGGTERDSIGDTVGVLRAY